VQRLAVEKEKMAQKEQEHIEMQESMRQRVRQIVEAGQNHEESGWSLLGAVKRVGPISSDTHIDQCWDLMGQAVQRLDDAEDSYEHAMRAGSFYDMDEGASEGIDR
jgi:hypothetical protein